MERFIHNFKKGMALVLSLAMVAGLVPAMSGGVHTVQAAGTEPSVTAYATKAQLMNAFKPDPSGNATTIGKLVFGKNSGGNAQEWYILGKDSGVSGDISGDNTIIFAASPIKIGQMFNLSGNAILFESSFGVYASDNPTYVYSSHYGASKLRAALQSMASNTNYFISAEQDLMNPTTVTTMDAEKREDYTTTDKLYALAADGYQSKTIKAGSDNSTVLAMDRYWSSGDKFWLRSPNGYDRDFALFVPPGSSVSSGSTRSQHSVYAVQPASNLNLSSVLFASAATAASSGTVSGTITSGTAMTLRLDGTDKDIGTVTYNTTTGEIKAIKGSTSQTVALVVQGKDGGNDWYYSKKIDASETINATDIKSALNFSSDIDLSDCKIWMEITDTDGLNYAVGAPVNITSVEITGIDTPAANTTLDTEASCATTGVSSIKPQITWTPSASTAGYNTSYTARITLTADTGYEFTDSTVSTVNGNEATNVTKNLNGTLTITYVFPATAKRKITGVTAPTVPTNNTFTTYYGYEGYDESPISGSSTELGTQATVTFEEVVAPTTESMNVTWTIANGGGAGYDETPGATNIFRWTISAFALTNYNASDCQGYDTVNGTITGTVMITNKAATPVNITGTDGSISYTGAAIDVSRYFTIDTNAGTATYSLITGADGVTGEGSLDGTTLTVTETGTFKIKVSTAANGIYAAGEANITLTVDNGSIEYTATGYSGTYDGQAHSISVNVTKPEGTTVTYSTDGTNYGSDIPSYTNAGTYTVYYRITKDNYTTVEDSKTLTINQKSVTITAEDQDIVWGNVIYQSKYTISEGGLLSGDSITEIALTPNTAALTENGTISISGVKIENSAGADVTGNYNIATSNGTLKIAHNTGLAPDSIDAVKTKTSYTAGDALNVDDITVTAYYADGYSETVTGFTTNKADINMSNVGDKTLTVSYTKNGGTKTKDITITVSHNTGLVPDRIDAIKPQTSYTAGDTLNVDDLTVTAYYEDGYSEAVTGYTTNASDIDMSKIGDKTLTISYTKNDGTKTKDITITVSHNTTLTPERIEASKTKTTYIEGETLNVDDITVTAYYADGYSETVTGFTTNAGTINMSVIGEKTLTVSYTKNEVTRTDDVSITVNAVEYTINVTDGTASVDAGTPITKATMGATVTLAANEAPSGQVFDKWVVVSGSITLADANSATTTFTMPAGAVSVKATYHTIPVTTYTVTFDSNGGTGSMEAKTVVSGTYTLPSNGFTAPTGKQFKGWSTSADGAVISGTTIEVTADTTLYAVWEYDILDGANSSWTENSDGSLSIRGSGAFSKFVGVKVDGTFVDAKYYTVKEGSTIVTLKAEYLNNFTKGSHTIEIVWTDGSASTTFAVKADTSTSGNNSQKDNDSGDSSNDVAVSGAAYKPENVPNSGDSTPIVWLFILSILSGAGLIFTVKKRIKKTNSSEK